MQEKEKALGVICEGRVGQRTPDLKVHERIHSPKAPAMPW
jgi:hypothetical protein